MIPMIVLFTFIAAILIGLWMLFFQRHTEESATKNLERNGQCKAHDGCALVAEGIVNLAWAWEKPRWVIGCADAIDEARRESRDFKTKQEIERAALRAARKNERMQSQRSSFFKFTESVATKRPSASRILRDWKGRQREGGKHAGGWRNCFRTPERRAMWRKSCAQLRSRIAREERAFMKPWRDAMRQGFPKPFSTLIDPRRTPAQIKSITDAQGATA